MRWLIILAVLLIFAAVALGVPWLAYRQGRKAGNQEGYIRGHREGRQGGDK